MTQASSLLNKLRQPIDAINKTLSLTNAYTDNDAVKHARTAHATYVSEIAKLDNLTKGFQYSTQEDRCNAYLSNCIQKEIHAADTVESIITEFESALFNARTAMELSFKVNKIELMRDRMVEKLVLSDVVPAMRVQDRIRNALSSLKQLSQIKYLVSEKVEDTSSLPSSFAAIQQMFSGDPTFKEHLTKFMSDPNPSENTAYRLELIRPVRAQENAGKAGYTSLACSSILKLLVRAITEVSVLREHWFASVGRLSTNTEKNPGPRFRTVCKDISQHTGADDQVNFHAGAERRLSRLDMALSLVVNVFCPVLLKETTEFIEILSQLGAHQHLDERASALESYKKYDIPERIDHDVKYLRFAQTNNPNCHPHYVPKALGYLAKRHSGMMQQAESVTALFNLVDKEVIPPKQLTGLYHLTSLVKYADNWGKIFKKYQDWFETLLSNRTQLIGNWETFKTDLPLYQQMLSDLKPALTELDLTTQNDYRDLVSTMTVNSELRDGYDQTRVRGRFVKDLADQSKQKELRSKLHSILDTGYDISRQIRDISKMVSQFKEPQNFDPENYRAFYQVVNDYLQFNNWFCHDLDVIDQLYR